MTNEERAKQYVHDMKAPSMPAHELVADLKRMFDEVRAQALKDAVEVCEREARACLSHAKAFRETRPKGRIPIHEAHEMAGQQSSACGAYIKQLT